jgi:hypothetical protein
MLCNVIQPFQHFLLPFAMVTHISCHKSMWCVV